MTKDEVLEKVKAIIVEQLGADESEIKLESNFRRKTSSSSQKLL